MGIGIVESEVEIFGRTLPKLRLPSLLMLSRVGRVTIDVDGEVDDGLLDIDGVAVG
jgi:hypothetical protein